jgi:YbbR domain-containing protein
MTTRQQNKKEGKEKVKAFFHGNTWRKILAFSFFLLIAFGFWVLQYLQQRFETSIVVPLNYRNVPEQIALNPGLPQEISLRIADKGTALLNYTLSQKITSVDIDLEKINPVRSTYSISGIALEKEITKYLLASTSLVGYTPDKIEVKYNPQKKKTVPVRIAGVILPKAGFMFEDNIYPDPEEITIYGSEVVLDTIQAIYTKSLHLTDLQSHFEKRVDLVFPEGIGSDKKSVLLSGDIEGYTEKTFKLPVVCENVPDNYVVRLFPPVAELTCQVALSKYSSLSGDDFKLSVGYDNLIENKGSTVPVRVSVTPQWVRHFRLSPENIEFLIERRSEYD